MADTPFDLSKFDPSSLDLSHLDPNERGRILRREFVPPEVALLLDRKNPWTKSGKPVPLPPDKPTGTYAPEQRRTNPPAGDADLLKFMPEPLRAEYDQADPDRQKILWEANKRAFELAKKRKAEELVREQDRTEKILDKLQRFKEDPSKAHLLPKSESWADLD